MSKSRILKLLFLCCACVLLAQGAKAFPDYLRLYNADPFAKAELKGKCAVCHVNPAGGGPRNDFGKAFAAADYKITPALRQQFPAQFISGEQSAAPPVTFTGDDEAVVELNGKRYAINTRAKTVKEVGAQPAPPAAIAKTPEPEPEKRPAIYQTVDVRNINLPTAIPIPKGSLWTDFTHRFPFGDPTDARGIFGLDSIAYPSFGVIYGVTNRIQIGAFRSPGGLGRAIELQAGVQALQESKGDPVTLQARVGLEGRDNFQRNFSTSFEFTVARSITRHAQIYFVPTITVGDRPYTVSASQNAPGKTAVALGLGTAVAIRPSVALMAEVNGRVNEEGQYLDSFTGIRRPVFGFGIQKMSSSRRHGFTLTFANGPGSTMAQRSMTRGLGGSDDTLRGLTIGFNIVRRIF